MTGHMLTTELKTTIDENPEMELLTLEDKKKDVIPNVIADPYCREILRATNQNPTSCIEINSATGIPISTVYRRIQTLCDAGLLETSGSISEDGKKFFLYKSKIKKIYMKYDGSLQITVIPHHSE